ncbi:hypothetical protein CORC01_08464 [Colletotrichum orchidophilum]|uniref:Uncharacterized protein n=1 Tax=Colletotrichum orchidophilum TaxID=1209926 RepID=A0A1G4B4H3_9PEZI|nr:uncharacterized protein CORC01_08464 [Colletotrichum orchidophilum]OHE96246.1 hypothetical protein CORC01_08464 [Colletotrichum orchidophilum]
MSSKHERNNGEWSGPRRLPSVREKLSGFVRRGREKAKKTTMSVLGESRHERPSLDESMKDSPRVQVQDFGTSSLEIDLQSLEAFRMAPPEPAKQAGQQKQVKKTSSRTSSMTPIADMFARKATTAALATIDIRSLNKSSPSLLTSAAASKPAEARRPGQAPLLRAAAPSSAASVIIINNGSTGQAQSHTSKPWPPPETPRTAAAPIRTQFSSTASASNQSNRAPLHEPPRRAAFVPAYVPSRAAPITTPAEPVTRPHQQNADAVARQQRLSHNTDKRHSTPTGMPSLPTTTTTTTTTALAPNKLLLAEIVQTDRRRSWQPAPTSVPSASGTPTSSGPPSASAPWRDRDLGSSRKASSRIASDRLAWIRELEDGRKKKSTINGDLPVLRTMQGGVADKLAKFESQRQQQQQQQQVPLTRSNSTRSRISSVADTTFSSYNGPATARSSLDTCRTSSVFSHYDDSFREKMEFIAGAANRAADDEIEEKPVLAKVTSAFVPVEKVDGIAGHATRAADDRIEDKPALTDAMPAVVPVAEKVDVTTVHASLAPADDENEKTPALPEVTSTFVSVGKMIKPTCVIKPQPV